MRVWEKIEQYDTERGSWTGWLTALTRNAALNRARQNRHSDAAEALSAETPSQEPTPEERILQEERRADLMHALNQLAQKDRMLFYRKYYYRQSTAQIASELGMTERAVEGRLYRLRRKLQQWLGGEHDA